MPRSYELLKDLRGQGWAAVISGAGPSVLVLGPSERLSELAVWNVRGFSGRPLPIGTMSRLEHH